MRQTLLNLWTRRIGRRLFLKMSAAGMLLVWPPGAKLAAAALPAHPLFWIVDIPPQPFTAPQHPNHHAGVTALLNCMGHNGLKFYRSPQAGLLSGPQGMIAPGDIVLIKVNAQWKYRGCTNSDVVRGVIQKILDHPEGFTGEVVIIENGQGRGSLKCDNPVYYPDGTVHANANDESHSFTYLVDQVFRDPRVSYFLLDPIRSVFISAGEHQVNGYRTYENVSYPCFTTPRGHRVELREGLWQGGQYTQNLKLINIPVLKHHDTGGSEITASLKHVYGILSMADGQSPYRHYAGLGDTCGKMMVSVRTPVLNIIDAIWVSHLSLAGYPANTTFRANQLLASQDPVALDYWAAKYILYPIDHNTRHHPDFSGIKQWLGAAAALINARGGLSNPAGGVLVSQVTMNEPDMTVFKRNCGPAGLEAVLGLLLGG